MNIIKATLRIGVFLLPGGSVILATLWLFNRWRTARAAKKLNA